MPAVAECRPDVWGRLSFFGTPFFFTRINDADQPLGTGMDVEMMDLHGLLMAPPMPVESLDQIKLQPEELIGVGAISSDEFLGHVVLALSQKAKSRKARCDDLDRNKRFQFRPTLNEWTIASAEFNVASSS